MFARVVDASEHFRINRSFVRKQEFKIPCCRHQLSLWKLIDEMM